MLHIKRRHPYNNMSCVKYLFRVKNDDGNEIKVFVVDDSYMKIPKKLQYCLCVFSCVYIRWQLYFYHQLVVF